MHGMMPSPAVRAPVVKDHDMLFLAFGQEAPKGYRVGDSCESTHTTVLYRIGSDADRINMSAVSFDAIVNKRPRVM